MEVEVIHPYTPQHDDELMLKRGDVIHNVEALEKGWCHGELRGRQGVFPDNFVKFVNSGLKRTLPGGMSPQTLAPTKKRDMGGRRCKVLFSYAPQHEDELPLNEGDILTILDEVEEGWWKGVLNGKVGMFPSNFVEEITEDQPPAQTRPKDIYMIDTAKPVNGVTNAELPEKAVEMNGVSKPLGSANSAFHPVHYDKNAKDTNGESLKSSNEVLSNKVSPVSKLSRPSISNQDKNKDTITINVGDGPKKIIGQKVLPSACDLKPPHPQPSSVTPEPHSQLPPPELPPKPVREWARVVYPYHAEHEDELSLLEDDLIIILSKDLEDKGWWKGELNGRIGVFPDNFVEITSVEDLSPQPKPPRPEKRPSHPGAPSSPKKSPSSNLEPTSMKGQQPPPPLPGKKVIPPPVPSQKKPSAPPPITDVPDSKPKSEVNEEERSLTIGRENRLVHMVHTRPKGPANRKPPSQTFLEDRKSSPDFEQVLAMTSNHNAVIENHDKTAEDRTAPSNLPPSSGVAGTGPPSSAKDKETNASENIPPPWLVELRENQVKKRRSGILSSAELESATVASASQTPTPSPLANSSILQNALPSQSSKPGHSQPFSGIQPPPPFVTSTSPSEIENAPPLSSTSRSKPQPGVTSHSSISSVSSTPAPSHARSSRSSHSHAVAGQNHHPSRPFKTPTHPIQNEELPPGSSSVQFRKHIIAEENKVQAPSKPDNTHLSLEKIYNEIVPKMKHLEERLEEQHQVHSRQLKLLMSELDDERKKRACLEIEIERLNKLVSAYAHV